MNKKYITLEEMVKHFRSKNQSVDELVEAFIKIIPLKIRLSGMNLNPSHNFLLYVDSQKLKQELAEIQTNLEIQLEDGNK